jgi:hypothetical protein
MLVRVPVIIGRAIFGKAQHMSATLSSQRRAASPSPGSIDEQLWQSLFPGQGPYDAQTCAAMLASRLREAANSLEPQQHQQQQQQQQQRIEPGKPKRCKVDRGKVGAAAAIPALSFLAAGRSLSPLLPLH